MYYFCSSTQFIGHIKYICFEKLGGQKFKCDNKQEVFTIKYVANWFVILF